MTHDLLIIGAGAAGAGAWREADARGLDTVWIEAKDRTGGRCWTDTATLSSPFDLGCHWLHTPESNAFRAYADEIGYGYETRPLPLGGHDGRRFLTEAEVEACAACFERFHDDIADACEAGRKISVAEALDLSTSEALRCAPFFIAWAEHEFAGSAHAVSAMDHSAHVVSPEDFPIPGGYGALLQRMIAGAPVRLDCPATAIDLSRADRVRVETTQGAVEVTAVVLTVSTEVLRQERIALTPRGWPEATRRAIDATPLGSSTKIALELPASAIPDELRNRLVTCLEESPRIVGWHFAPHGFDAAIAYLGGAFSRELCLAGEAAQIAYAREDLGRLLGAGVAARTGAGVATPFDRDPWIGGGYSYCRAETGSLRAELAAPIEDRLFFAGEACSIDLAATAHGAYDTGRDAVRAAAARLAT